MNKKSLIQRSAKFIKIIKTDGILWALIRLLLKIFNQPNEIQRSKNKILNHLLNIHDCKVAHGEFKGMRLNKNNFWSKNDLITYILGVYEKHVVSQLIKFSKLNNKVFIDIGAADGYFAVGMAHSKFFKKVYAFEIETLARENLKKNAKDNFCDNKIFINKEANFNSLKKIIDIDEISTILIDIEGGEFELLSKDILNLVKKCMVIIELHPNLVIDGSKKQERLLNICEDFFEISMIESESYNPNKFEELNQFADEDRLISFGEGRGTNMQWLVLVPKKN